MPQDVVSVRNVLSKLELYNYWSGKAGILSGEATEPGLPLLPINALTCHNLCYRNENGRGRQTMNIKHIF
jgi:hypothetical protein